ncbi:hypothetical protein EV189_1038 [Motilibacter rhizosphaerae]|uniref:VOC domain-containing protein n=1 Tax=Motilibacter rhizosphaerae TaxID=598652 RepID=A0A4Q7NXX8_9ACTN|nr:VOC family protein [Motilibacter rhizosphaerae]RZS91788.1 hypothetical protein EV189_1038 [Motilibacter rhizosphaerae]
MTSTTGQPGAAGPLDPGRAFSGFSCAASGPGDVEDMRAFYTGVLGVPTDVEHGMLWLHLAPGRDVLVYPKPGHQPATSTVLNFPVDDVAAAVDALAAAGVTPERYPGMDQDERGINRGGGPLIAWFLDPAGNPFSVLQG